MTADLSRGSVRAANLPRGSEGRGVTLDATGSKDADMARLRPSYPGFSAHLAAARHARAQAIGDAPKSWALRRLVPRVAMLLALVLYALVLHDLLGSAVSPWAMAAVFVAALISSVAGFAFSAICGAILFHLVDDPVRAVQIMMVCSLGGQAIMTWSLRRAVCWRALAAFALGGAVGLPVGLHILLHTPTALFTRVLGGLIVLHAGWTILRRPTAVARQHPAFDLLAGVLGGITGGAAAFPGAPVTIWCGLKGWSKERQRGVYQPFILLLQLGAIACLAMPGLTSGHAHDFDFVGIAYLPAMLAGCAFGMGVFRWLSDRHFALGVNGLLLVSGASLLV